MKFLTFLILALVTSATGRAQRAGSEGLLRSEIVPPGEVIDVLFQGNHAISSDELATVTTAKVTGMFSTGLYYHTLGLLRVFGSPYQFSEKTTLQRDTAELNRYYRDHGYLLARSSFRVAHNRDDLKAYNDYVRRERLMKAPAGGDKTPAPEIRDTIIYTIVEGPPFSISRITLVGLESLPLEFQPELTEHVTVKQGEQWSRPVAAKEVERLSKIMVENGYPFFRADTIFVDHIDGMKSVNVLMYFTPGHRFRYGPVHIVYDTSVPSKAHVAERVVLAQLYLDSGNWYKLSDIQRSEAALQGLGTFDLVRVSLDTSYLNSSRPDALRDSSAVPVRVFLRMRQVFETPLSVFFGTTAQNAAIVGGSIGLIDRNLTQIADNFDLQFSAQPLPPTQQRYAANIDYHMPYIGLGRIPLTIGLGGSRQFQTNDPAYDQRNVSAHVGTSIRLSKLDNRTTITPDVLVEYLTTMTGDAAIRASAPPQQVNLLPSVGYQDDETNDPIYPTSGTLLSTFFEYGVPSDLFALISPNDPNTASSAYWKLVPQIKYYLDLSSTGRSVLATRVRVGITRLQAGPNRPPSLNHRFFGGGATSNRGWGEQTLVVSDNPAWDGSLGGYNDLEGNLELRLAPWQYAEQYTGWEKFSDPIRFVLFYDIGNVWDNSFYDAWAFKLDKLAQTIGLGLRYNLFFGALRVDCGFKLYDPSGRFDDQSTAITQSDKGAWLFSQPKLFWGAHTFNWHFGIAQAF